MGAKRGAYRLTWVEAGDWLRETPLGGIQRSADAVRARPRLADARTVAAGLRRLDVDISVEEVVRLRIPVRRAAVHAPALSCLDRLPRHPGRVHARARERLLREQPPRHVCPAAIRAPQSEEVQGLRRERVGHYRE